MVSNINTNNIDTQYPVPGIDNDTEGFRSNFLSIKEGLDTAKTEIDDILNNTARTDEETDFNGSTVKDSNFIETTKAVYDIGNISTHSDISFSNGHYQIVSISSDLTLTIKDWPSEERFAELYVQVTADDNLRSVTWLTSGGTIKVNQNFPLELYDSTDGSDISVGGFPQPFTLTSSVNPKIVKFWTVNGGAIVFADYIGEFI
jgi:hypothetical protein